MSYAGRYVHADRARRSEDPGRLSCSGLVASLEEGVVTGVFGARGLKGWRVLVSGAFVAVALPVVGGALSSPVSAATVLSVPGDCALDAAILAADTGTTVTADGGCSNPTGSRLIEITATQTNCYGEGTYVGGTPTMLPDITVPMTIEGSGSVTIYGDGCGSLGSGIYDQGSRLFYVAPGGSLTLQNLQVDSSSILGAEAGAPGDGAGGDAYGGAIYADGALRLENVLMSENSASGGTAGGFTNTTTHDWGGGSAYGGAIYSTSNVVVTGSVFWDNTVTGSDAVPATGTPSYTVATQTGTPAGGSGGDAMGADLALRPGCSGANLRHGLRLEYRDRRVGRRGRRRP